MTWLLMLQYCADKTKSAKGLRCSSSVLDQGRTDKREEKLRDSPLVPLLLIKDGIVRREETLKGPDVPALLTKDRTEFHCY